MLRLPENGSPERFLEAKPFPYAVYDSLIVDPAAVADSFPPVEHSDWRSKDYPEQRRRLGGLQRHGLRAAGPALRALLDELCSPNTLRWVEAQTGIAGLVADERFAGAGAHCTLRGGGLGVHLDFTRDRKRDLHRAATLLLYTNPLWEPEWGGALELWDASEKRVEILPAPGRGVLFANTEESYHGQPEPVQCPEAIPRRVISACFYVEDRPRRSVARGALWHPTSGKIRESSANRTNAI